MDCTVWNERHRTRLAFRRPGAGAHRDIERGKEPSATTAVSPFLYCFTMSWWVGGSLRTCSFSFFGLGAATAAAHKISTEAERGTGYCFLLLRLRYNYCCFLCVYSIDVAAVEKGCMPEKANKILLFLFWWLRCCCFSLIERDVLKKMRLVFAFCLIRVRNQSR